MNTKKIIKWSIVIIIILGIALLSYNSFFAAGKYDKLAKCLTEKGVVMYGTDWCPHCQNQKKQFGNSFQYVNFKNCDFNKVLCDANNVTGYPTWISKGKRLEGEQSFEALASMAGCEVN